MLLIKTPFREISKKYQVKKLFDDNIENVNSGSIFLKLAKYDKTDIVYSVINKNNYILEHNANNNFFLVCDVNNNAGTQIGVIFKYVYYYKNINILINYLNIFLKICKKKYNSSNDFGTSFANLIFLNCLKYIKTKKSSFYKECKKYYFDYSSCSIYDIFKSKVLSNIYITIPDILELLNLYHKYQPINTLHKYRTNIILSNKFNMFICLFVNLNKKTNNNHFIANLVSNRNKTNIFNTLFNKQKYDKGTTMQFIFAYVILLCTYINNINLLGDFVDYIINIKYEYKFTLVMSLNSQINWVNNFYNEYKTCTGLAHYLSYNFKHDIKYLYEKKAFVIISKFINNLNNYDNIKYQEYPVIKKFVDSITQKTKLSPIDKLILHNIHNSNIINTNEFQIEKNNFVDLLP